MLKLTIKDLEKKNGQETYESAKACKAVFSVELDTDGGLAMIMTLGGRNIDTRVAIESLATAMKEFAGALAEHGIKSEREELQLSLQNEYVRQMVMDTRKNAWESVTELLYGEYGDEEEH